MFVKKDATGILAEGPSLDFSRDGLNFKKGTGPANNYVHTFEQKIYGLEDRTPDPYSCGADNVLLCRL